MEHVYRIGTRSSTLALRQVEEIIDKLTKFYPGFRAHIVRLDTFGDKNKNIPISEIEGTDFFTREIDSALLEGKIDFAVHSAKDLPSVLPDGLAIAAVTSSIDRFDVLVSKNNFKLNELPAGARIGTSSERRKMQLMQYRDGFKIIDLRGNIEERLQKLYKDDLDAIVIAAAGLIRLGLADRITERLPCAIMQPHPLQGALAVVVRTEDFNMLTMLRKLSA